jgi:tetratricopeptide (TPR) repeat protein
MHLLALLYLAQNRDAEAESLAQQAFAIQNRDLGAHPDTTKSFVTLVDLYAEQDRLAELESLFKNALAVCNRDIGFDSSRSIALRNALIEYYRHQQRLADLRPLLLEQHEACDRRLERGDVTPDDLNNFAWLLLTSEEEGRRDARRALELAERACERVETADGEHPWMYLDTLALAQHQTGRTDRAIETARRAISLIPRDAYPPLVAMVHRNLRTFEAALAGSGNPPSKEGDR